MRRFIWAASLAAILSTLTYSQLAQAHRVTHRHSNWAAKAQADSSPIVTPFCDGKYDVMAKTLNRQDIVGEVNFYRINAGLPKLKTTKISGGFVNRGYYTRAETRLRDAQLLLERGQTHLSQKAEADYLQKLDIATPSGPSLDWWLTADMTKPMEEGQYCPPSYHQNVNGALCEKTPTARTIRKSAGFDWLMTGHQMRTARDYWDLQGVIKTESTHRIFDHIDQQALKRPGVNIWMAHYAHHKTLFPEMDRTVPPEIAQRAEAVISDIMTCQASPANYAIIAKGDLGLPRDYLPKTLAERRAQRDIRQLTLAALRDGTGLDLAYHARLQELSEALQYKPWADPYFLLSAPNLEAASKAGILSFSLPAAHIPDTYPAMRLGHALTENNIELGLQLSAQVYGDYLEKAKADLEDVKANLKRNQGSSPHYVNHLRQRVAAQQQRYNRFKDYQISKAGLPGKVEIALTSLFAGASHNLNPHHRDVYQTQTSDEFLNIYLRRQLFPALDLNHSRFYRYRLPHMRYNDIENSAAKDLPSLRKNDGTPEIGFAALVDWDKVESLGGDNRLTRTIAMTIFDWLDQASPQDRAEHGALMSQALYDIIRMCRHENAGEIDGGPVQKRAFERLHKFYGSSEPAQKTRYWWPSKNRHGYLPL